MRGVDSAWLVFGIDDRTHLAIGSLYKNSAVSLNRLKQDLSQHTTDKHTFFEIYQVEKDNKRVLMFQILPSPKGTPISWKGVRYARNGESLAPLSDSKIDRIRNQKITEDWSSLVIEDATIEDLDPQAIFRARENYAKKHPEKISEMEGWSDITFLNKARVTRKGKITNTAIVLLGKEDSEVLLSPTVAKIRWVLKDSLGAERDYMIKSCPFILAVDEIYNKIRNLKYRYINPYFQTLFPEELDTYDPYVIREAINNAIAHQDYKLSGRINVVEYDDRLVFSNKGGFIPNDIQSVLVSDAPEEEYRNDFLVTAMVELNMVDTIGSGIRKMFGKQLERLFPMPDYDITRDRVQVTIIGQILDMDYSVMLTKHKELSLSEIEMLNRVLFKKSLSDIEIKHLRRKKLIEGRKPNIFLARSLADSIDKKVEYTRNKGFNDTYYKDFILEAIKNYGQMSRVEVDKLLIDKFPEVLNEKQKYNKVRNLLTTLRKEGRIKSNEGKLWILNEL
ncbi:MAG: ATP-binding protein [bacterium]